MFYFNYFPKILYDPDGSGNVRIVTNIMKRIRVRANMKKEFTFLDPYDVQDGETPEMVADKHHGSPLYHWIVLLLNNITDVNHDWPKSVRQFQLYMKGKYGDYSKQIETHHYEIAQTSGDTTTMIEVENSSYPLASAVTNYNYEHAVNESKRSIDLLRNDYLGNFVFEFENIIST